MPDFKVGDTVRTSATSNPAIPSILYGKTGTITAILSHNVVVLFGSKEEDEWLLNPSDLELVQAYDPNVSHQATDEPTQTVNAPIYGILDNGDLIFKTAPEPTPEPVYISIIVAPYAIADFIRALYRNGDHDIAVTKEDNSLTVRIPLNENHPPKNTAPMNECGEKEKGK